MKKFTLILLCLIPYLGFSQVSLHKWTFNTKDSTGIADATVSSGTRIPQLGNGSIQLAGTVINTYSDGVVNDSSSLGDNSGIQLATFPSNGTKRDTSGIVFKMNTSGYCNLFFSWYQRHSATSSKFVKLLYTVDGVNWLQYTGPGTDTTNSLYRSMVSNTFIYRTADFSAVSGVNNNPLFALKIVSTFSPNGSSYLGTTGNYATSGTYRFDLVQLKAHPIPQVISPQKLQLISNTNGISVVEGNYQSITNSTIENEFYVLTGKGPEIVQDNLICGQNKVMINPSNSLKPKLLKVRINPDSNFFSVINERSINYSFKQSIDGNLSETLSDFKKQVSFTDTISDCIEGKANKLSPFSMRGYNPKGLSIVNNNIWMLDEFRTGFVCMNANSKIVYQFSPYETDSVFLIDQQLKYTNPGYGFSNLTQTPQQLLFSISAKPLFKDSIPNSDRIHRLIAFNPISHELTTYLVLNSGTEGAVSASDWTIDELVAIGNEDFLIYEHAENQTQQIKRISKISIKNATPLTNKIYTYNGSSGPVEVLLNETGLAANQIVPAAKSNLIDLNKNGLPANFDNISGMHLQNDSTLYLITNNNNGLNLTTNQGAIVPAQVTESKIAIVKLTGDLKLNQVVVNNNNINSLGDFSLNTQAMNKTIDLDSINFKALNLTWTSSTGAAIYAYSIDTSANIESAAILKNTLQSTDTTYQLNFGELNTLANTVKLSKGDSIAIYITVWSYNNYNDSLPSNQTILCYLKSPLVPEKFSFLNPTFSNFEANRKKGNELNISWTKSNYANTYALSIDTSINQSNSNAHLLTLNTSDTAIVLNSAFLDSLTQKLGISYGNAILLTFNVTASNNQGNTLKISDYIQVNVLRADKILGDFSIKSPNTGFKIVVNPNDTGTIQLEWTASDYATAYVLSVNLNGTELEKVNLGNQLKHNISIADVLAKQPLDRGDTLNIDFNVYALFNKNEFNDSLKATNDIYGMFIRLLNFDSIIITRPAPFVQLNLNNNQNDSLIFEWNNPNPFAVQQLNLISENSFDTVSYTMNNNQTSFAITKNQLYTQYLSNKAVNDSIFINWNISEKYKQFVNYSENRSICLKKTEITGLNDFLDLSKVSIYPNPSSKGIFTIYSADSKILNVEMFDQLGAAIPLAIQIENTQTQVQTPELSGVFYLKIQFQNKVCIKPILIGR